MTEVEEKLQGHDEAIRQLFGALKKLVESPDRPGRREIGFPVKNASKTQVGKLVADA